MKKLDQTSILNRIWNALNKGLSNMDTIAWLTALYIALYIGVIHDDIKKEPPKEPPKVEQTK
jgi:hypothetical protein